MTVAYIGLGSNLDNPGAQLDNAIAALHNQPGIASVEESPRYGSKAIGPGEQPDYLNSCARLHTSLSAEQLLDTLQGIENQQGRVRTLRWGARTLDLDLLLYGTQIIDTPRLQVPHPRIAERAFVLRPLCDLQADLQLPVGGLLSALLTGLDDQQLTPLP